MAREVIHTDKAASGKVPLSQAIRDGDLLFCSGQLGVDPKTNALVPGGIAAETRQALENLKAVVEAGGSSLDRALKVTIFMADLSELMEMNAVFSEYFPKDPPARTTLAVKELVRGGRVEIELICRCSA
ncbi:MAG: RidA family protein [Nitrospinota bacterium]